MNIKVGTKSKLKIEAVQEIASMYLIHQPTIIGYEVESGVPSTPFNEQTYQGAKNRAYYLYKQKSTNVNCLCLGLESGLVYREGYLFEECWCVIIDNKGKEYVGYSSGFKLPEDIVVRIESGETHLTIMTEKGQELDIHEKDTWAIYSNNKLLRSISIKEAIRNTLLSIHS
jgi:non-canonical (house-cleaning) NTP pyrophosphatase